MWTVISGQKKKPSLPSPSSFFPLFLPPSSWRFTTKLKSLGMVLQATWVPPEHLFFFLFFFFFFFFFFFVFFFFFFWREEQPATTNNIILALYHYAEEPGNGAIWWLFCTQKCHSPKTNMYCYFWNKRKKKPFSSFFPLFLPPSSWRFTTKLKPGNGAVGNTDSCWTLFLFFGKNNSNNNTTTNNKQQQTLKHHHHHLRSLK